MQVYHRAGLGNAATATLSAGIPNRGSRGVEQSEFRRGNLARSVYCVRPQPMSRLPRSTVLGFLAASVLLLGFPAVAYAQDVQAQIAKHQERIDKLANEFWTSQRRLVASAGGDSSQDLTYDQLDVIGHLLRTASREFSMLTTSLMLASLVTD